MSPHRFETDRLRRSRYPGRGIVVGASPDGAALVQIYWIMGRSPSSRNRVFVRDGDAVRTAIVDPSIPADPLTLYAPVRVVGRAHVVSNGDQTDTIADGLLAGRSFAQALDARTYEPDAPNYTPRISGIVDLDDDATAFRLSILKRSPAEDGGCVRQTFAYERAVAGTGFCVTTYLDDGAPLPSFCGEPYPVEIPETAADAAGFFWSLLNPEHRVALLAKWIDRESGGAGVEIRNRFGPGAGAA